jgi:FKBP-type peptidyl-prolyl cis-trans isomerase
MAATPTSDMDKFSYVVGLNLGTNFASQGVMVNPAMVMQGLQDGLAGNTPLLTPQEQEKIMTSYLQKQLSLVKQKQQQESSMNSVAGVKFLKANASNDGVVTLADGLQYQILTEGNGQKPSASDTVEVNYEGKLIDGTVFDSSYKRGKPATFAVNQVIPGWTEVLQLMPVGSTWMVYIPANLAYGATGIPNVIPPGSVLIFKVELISIKN